MTHYTRHAKALFAKYHQMNSAKVHQGWLQHLPNQPGLACDIGAGSGRDASWLAEQGWDVIAVEPEAAFRVQAQKQEKTHNHPNVSWLDDRLPELGQLWKWGQIYFPKKIKTSLVRHFAKNKSVPITLSHLSN